MKKLFITMLGIVAILCTTACSDEKFVAEAEGDTMVEFTVALTDGEDASRAISDGQTVTHLYYEVFTHVKDDSGKDEWTSMGSLKNSTELLAGTTETGGNKYATVRLALVKGQAYDIVFWASKEGVYNTDDLRTITVAGEGSLANDESKDAFTAVYRTAKVTGPIKETIYLTRPFAQINFGTTVQDYEDALKAGIDFGAASKVIEGTLASKIEVSHGATVYDALTEKSTDDGQALTFGWTSVKYNVENEKLMVGGVEYKYLATAYMLVPGGYESNVSDVKMEIETGLNENITLAVPFAPVQRNYRTNVLGNLLTNTADFTIIVDPIYNKPDKNYDVDQTETVSTAAELQAAIDAAILGNNVITFGADITGDIIVPQNEGINIVINGAGYEFDGTFDIYGDSRHTGTETLTFNEIDFVHADGAKDFISCSTTESKKRYAHNVTVSNCTFTGNDNGDVVGMRYRQCYNMTVLNCTATNVHSLMWATGVTGIEIDGVVVNAKSGGISVGTSTPVVVKNSNITVSEDYGYGLRADASGAYKMNVANCELKADAPILARNASGAYTLTLEGDNTLTSTDAYQIIVTKSDDYKAGITLEAPTGNYTLTGAEGYTVYPTFTAAATGKDVVDAIKAGKSVVLADNVNVGTTQLAVDGDVTIDLNGKKLTTEMSYGGMTLKNGASIKNGVIEHTSTVAAIKAFNAGSIEDVTIVCSCTTANKVVTGIAVQQGGHVGTIKNVTVEGASQCIEVPYQATVDLIDNVNVAGKNNGITADGTEAVGQGLLINGGKVVKAVNSTFKGDDYGIQMHLKGVFDVSLELVNCKAEGNTAAIYAWDEKGKANAHCSTFTLTYDAATVLTGGLIWDFEEECNEIAKLNAPN